MFDPKVLLDAMVAGSAHRPQEGQGGAAGFGGLGDILGQLAKAAQSGQQQQELPQAGGGGQMTGGSGGIGDILSKLGQGAQQAGSGQPGTRSRRNIAQVGGGRRQHVTGQG